MRLTEIKDISPMNVERDYKFESLGLLSHNNTVAAQLVYIENEKYLPLIRDNSNIASVITTEEISIKIPEHLGLAIARNPRKSFYEVHNHIARKKTYFYRKLFKTTISEFATIHPTAFIAKMNVQIGDGCEIGPNSSILKGSIIKNDVIIRAGVVIGSEGFQFNRFENEMMPVYHAGGVLINDRVELQSNCCVSKSLFGGFTEIGKDTKFDNLVHIAHGVKIGDRCMFAACAMIAGSVIIGNDVWVGPSASISSRITIGDNASISLGSVVTKNVPAGKRVSGNFAIDHKKFIAFIKSIR